METGYALRHQTIERLTAPRTEQVADAAIHLWETMAGQVISIVGDGGFASLYARSVFLTQSTFPWVASGSVAPAGHHRFANLRTSFEGQGPAQVSQANRLLLVTFTDILASLIGEPLTTSILRLAWGNGASDRAGKEFEHE